MVGFWVQALGFWGLGPFRVWGFGLRVFKGFGFIRFGASGSGFGRVLGLGFGASSLGFGRVLGFGFGA